MTDKVGAEMQQRKNIHWWVVWPAIVAIAYITAQLLCIVGIWLLAQAGVVVDVSKANPTGVLILQVVASALMIALAIGGGYAVHQRATMADIGLTFLLRWRDIGMALVGFLAYILLSGLTLAALHALQWIDIGQRQDIGVESLVGNELLLGFAVFVVAVPVLEEVLFRGILYGKLRGARLPWWGAVVVTSILFAAAHMQWGTPAGQLSWNVAVDTFCMSLVVCGLRELTKSLWAPILVHMIKNGIAFYILFVIGLPNIPGAL